MSHACRMVISWYGGLYYESKKKKKKDRGRKEKGELKEIYSFADFELTNQKRTLRVKFLYF